MARVQYLIYARFQKKDDARMSHLMWTEIAQHPTIFRESLPTKMEKRCYAKFVIVKPINIDSVGRF